MEVGATLQLLYKHVILLPSGEVDASRILSRECYALWLASRNPRPKQPEEAFRKIIAAHCTGGSGMQPFSKPVEVSLLKLLRRKCIWDCFIGTECKIGLRGFKATGYWEKKAKKKQISDQTNKKFAPRSSSQKPAPAPILYEIVTDRAPITAYDLLESQNTYLKILATNSQAAKSLEAYVRLLSHFQSQELAQLFRVICFKRGWFSKLTSQHSSPVIINRMRFFLTREFLNPAPHERHFDQDEKIGSCFGHITVLKPLDDDKNLRDIYRGSVVGISAMSMRLFPHYSFLHQENVLRDLFLLGEGWSRTLEVRFDGQPIVLLKRYTFLHNRRDYGVMQCQDITHKYLNMLN